MFTYAEVELAIMEERPCLACHVPFYHGRRNPRFLVLDREWDPGAGIRAADRED